MQFGKGLSTCSRGVLCTNACCMFVGRYANLVPGAICVCTTPMNSRITAEANVRHKNIR